VREDEEKIVVTLEVRLVERRSSVRVVAKGP
jgi:hypothetical protein